MMNVRKKYLHGKDWSYIKNNTSSENGMQNLGTCKI